MKLTLKTISLYICAVIAALFAVFAVFTSKTVALAYSEQDVFVFQNEYYLAKNNIDTSDGYSRDFIGYHLKYDAGHFTDGCWGPNRMVNCKISLYRKTDVKTGWDSVDKNITYGDLSLTSNYQEIEYYDFTVKHGYAPRVTDSYENGVVLNSHKRPLDMENYIYITANNETIPLYAYIALRMQNTFFNESFDLMLSVRCASYYDHYVLGVKFEIENVVEKLFTTHREKEVKSDTTTSPCASFASVVKAYVDSDNFGSNSEARAYYTQKYNELVEESSTKEYTVRYLEQFGDTPFAVMKSKNVTLTLDSKGSINSVDVCKAVGKDVFKVFGSVYKGIDQDETDRSILTVTYPKDTWLAAKDVDGRTVNQYLDINTSYQKAFDPLVTKGVISRDVYEYFYAQAVGNAYPELAAAGYFAGDVYGYWTYVVTPQTFTLNALLDDLANAGTSYTGVLKQHHYVESLSYDAYEELLTSYNYPWLSRLWNEIFGAVTSYDATHYIIVCDPLEKDGFVVLSDILDLDPNEVK